MATNLENREKETQTLFDLEFCEKHRKKWEMRNAYCRTWSMARKLKKVENETQTLFDREYGEKH